MASSKPSAYCFWQPVTYSETQFGPEEDALAIKVHDLVWSCPDRFIEAGRALDKDFSSASVARMMAPPVPEPHRRTALASAIEIGDEHSMMALRRGNRRTYRSPKKRFGVLLTFLQDHELEIHVPNPSWDWCARILLVYWLMTDENATSFDPVITEFQAWEWDESDEGIGREMARAMLAEHCWPSLLNCVRRGLQAAGVSIDSSLGTEGTAAPPHRHGTQTTEVEQLHTLEINQANNTAILDDVPYALTEAQARVLQGLRGAGGGWVTGESLKQYAGSGERPDRVIESLPGEVRSLVVAKQGQGRRLDLRKDKPQ